ncbi:hypothetical protein GUITHDRAFT_155009 [Guillardia theta CCMP2712]|uniref:Uncharacterized protein n=1 Tax=Guillardia theta (strain CCMP2712) TaxID=905079 RepID=L1IM57_GUITC|nr:hypothetical protein GUITHDRAFT_155009 [Guillardia theta CCMP2712]EKX37321.1 hypothetical protein GUITHDRAFT_155009 [Guillardia theta CCMP2712]|mmetsp:Transcript_17441/g.57697  ORF Transcript_17441/g.57697 Transcript_17441/m.57697 type:complete len:105 (+) Transcript_17441:42-356(+)|eukprot:XP_005824301.1 hypothetical protein GUITHDRAFT_155009 [Guillardia theta CCMP2712]
MFQVLIMGTALRNQEAQYVEPGRTCYTTGGICPKRIQVIKNCVTEGFCGGKRGPLTGIERLKWKPLHFLKEDGVADSLTKANASAAGYQSEFKNRPFPPLFTNS